MGLAKPDPRIYALTCERLEIAPHEAIFLDDTPMSVDAANAFGMQGVLHRSTSESIRTISEFLEDPNQAS